MAGRFGGLGEDGFVFERTGMMDRIKIGQLGVCHEHAPGKMQTLRLLPEVFEIVGVVDDRPTATTAKFVGSDFKMYDGVKMMTEEELFQTPGLQAVAVEVPNLELVPAAFRCLERNLPIHMDKPGGDSYDEFERLRSGYEKRDLPFQMGYMFRGNPAMRWIQEAFRKGWLGEIFEVQASMSHNYGDKEYQEYMGQLPGGIMFNLGCHLIDFVVSLMGRPSTVTPFLLSAPGDPDRIKNNCVSILTYPHATVTLRASSREVDGLSRRRLKICGTKGSVDLCPLERFDGQPLTMDLVLNEDAAELAAGKHTLSFDPVRDRYEEQLMDLARMIRGEIKNPYDIHHDCLVQEVLMAASGITNWNATGV